jgi:hypothetical protein
MSTFVTFKRQFQVDELARLSLADREPVPKNPLRLLPFSDATEIEREIPSVHRSKTVCEGRATRRGQEPKLLAMQAAASAKIA